MNTIQFQKKIRKWHRYLGLFLGIQFLFWTIGGLYFSWTKIESIRGEDLRSDKPSLSIAMGSRSIAELTDSLQKAESDIVFEQIQLVDILGKAHYQVHIKSPEKKVLLFNAKTLELAKKINESDALKIAKMALKTPSDVIEIEYITTTHGHHEYREKPLPAYAITFDKPNNTTVYVSVNLGTVQSFRNDKWRIFDFLWMMHTMDYQERDDFNNWLLRIFSIFGLVTLLSGFTLFFLTTKFQTKK